MGSNKTTDIIKRRSCEDMENTLCNLIDLDSQGPFHTWRGSHGRRIMMSRLDRAFCNENYLERWS